MITTKPAYSKYTLNYSHSGLHKMKKQVQGSAVSVSMLSTSQSFPTRNPVSPASRPGKHSWEEEAASHPATHSPPRPQPRGNAAARETWHSSCLCFEAQCHHGRWMFSLRVNSKNQAKPHRCDTISQRQTLVGSGLFKKTLIY